MSPDTSPAIYDSALGSAADILTAITNATTNEPDRVPGVEIQDDVISDDSPHLLMLDGRKHAVTDMSEFTDGAATGHVCIDGVSHTFRALQISTPDGDKVVASNPMADGWQIPDNIKMSFAIDPDSAGNFDAFMDAVVRQQKLAARRRATRAASAKLSAAIPAIQRKHDRHVANPGINDVPEPASGHLTFSRTDTSTYAMVRTGARASAFNGKRRVYFYVNEADLVPVGVASVTVPATCCHRGSIGNVAAGTVTKLGWGLTGFDSVTNTTAFVGGKDTAHRAKQAAKKALRADPSARAAQLQSLNAKTAPARARLRAGWLHTLALDIIDRAKAAKEPITLADATFKAEQRLARIEYDIAVRAAVKANQASLTYPSAGNDEHWFRPMFKVAASEQVAA